MPRLDENTPHVIRLLGPWEAWQYETRNAECGIDTLGDQKPSRVKVPLDLGDWLDPEFRGTVVLERAFGLPTNLDEQQSVRLTVQTNRPWIRLASLNETELTNLVPASTPSSNGDSDGQLLYRFEVTSLLKARNRLRLTLTVEAPPTGCLANVSIEIFA